MKITEHEENQISLIDSQVNLLQDRGAFDEAILEALFEFIPDIQCIVENAEKHDLDKLLAKHPGFTYLVGIVSLLSEH